MSNSIKESNFKQFVIICVLLLGVILSMILVFATLTVGDVGCSQAPVRFAEDRYNATCSCYDSQGNFYTPDKNKEINESLELKNE